MNSISDVMAWLASSAVDRGFRPSPDRVNPKTRKLIFVVSPLSTQHLRRKSNDYLAWDQDNVIEWGDMSIHGLLFQ